MSKANTYALDSTALMLPYLISKEQPPVYRFYMTVKEEVDPILLKQAVLDLVPRFPIMYTKLRKGFFWYKQEDASDLDIVEKDPGVLCRQFDYKNKAKPLLRVIYNHNEIGVELTHFTIDGTSCTIYLCSLVARYFELRGYTIEKNRFVLDSRDKPSESELADYFRETYEKPKKRIKQVEPPAFQCLTETRENYLRATIIDVPIDAMKALLKEKYGGCTITEYLNTVYACAFLQLYEKSNKKKPIRFEVPCNLRQYWGEDTLRNFSGISNVTVLPDKADYRFTDILELIRREMKEKLTKEKMHGFVCQNTRYLALLKYVPSFVKKTISVGYPFVAKRIWPFTSSISNVGYISLPPSLAEHIENYVIILGRFGVTRLVCAVTGVNNALNMVISAVNDSTAIQDYCIDFFKKDGLPVTVTIRE